MSWLVVGVYCCSSICTVLSRSCFSSSLLTFFALLRWFFPRPPCFLLGVSVYGSWPVTTEGVRISWTRKDLKELNGERNRTRYLMCKTTTTGEFPPGIEASIGGFFDHLGDQHVIGVGTRFVSSSPSCLVLAFFFFLPSFVLRLASLMLRLSTLTRKGTA